MNNYKVSICVPIYGVEKYIERCARSLFEQTYDNIEYVFVNDATKDNSIVLLQEVIHHYKAKSSNIKIINHAQNRGLAAARNTVVAAATGEFILHVDSDDYLEKNAVELLVKKQQESNADIVSADAIAYYPKYKERIIHPHFYSAKQMSINILNGNDCTYIWGRLIRRSLYIENHIEVCESINMGEDLQVASILAFYAKEVANLSVPVYHYECNNVNAYTSSYSKEKIRQNEISYHILCDFFKGKGNDYEEAIKVSSIRRLTRNLIIASQTGDKDFFSELLCRKRNIPRCYWKYVSTPKRVLLYMNNLLLMRIYISLVGGVKHLFQQYIGLK